MAQDKFVQPGNYFTVNASMAAWDSNVTTPGILGNSTMPNATTRSSRTNLEIGLVATVYTVQYLGVTLGITSIIMNVVFLIATKYIKDKTAAYHRFIKNLSVADVLSASSFLLISSWPQWGMAFASTKHGKKVLPLIAYVVRGLPWAFFTGYLLTLSGLTVNQYLAVCRPWRYCSIVSPSNVSICLIIIWLISALQLIIPLIICISIWGHNEENFLEQVQLLGAIEMQVWMCFFALSLLFNITLNIIIYLKINMLKMKRRMSSSHTQESLNIRMKQEAFITVALLLFISVFFRLPFPLMGMIGIQIMSPLVDASIVLLLYLNFFIDPIIYFLRMREVKKTWRYVLHGCGLSCFPVYEEGENSGFYTTGGSSIMDRTRGMSLRESDPVTTDGHSQMKLMDNSSSNILEDQEL